MVRGTFYVQRSFIVNNKKNKESTPQEQANEDSVTICFIGTTTGGKTTLKNRLLERTEITTPSTAPPKPL